MVLVLGFGLDLIVSSFTDDKQRNIEREVHLWMLIDVDLLVQEGSRFQDANLVSSKIFCRNFFICRRFSNDDILAKLVV